MNRFHNPMTLFMLIIILVAIFVVTIVFLIVDSLSLNFVYWIIIGVLLISLLIVVIGEWKFRKYDKLDSEKFGIDYNSASVASESLKESSKVTILTILGILLFISGLTALFMYNSVIGSLVFAVIILSLLLIPLYLNKKRNSIEEYIAIPLFRKARPVMQEIHERIHSISPNIHSGIGSVYLLTNVPVYVYAIDEATSESISVFSMETLIGGNRIRFCPCNPNVFNIFADKLKKYKTSGHSEVFMSTKEPFDYELITDIVKYNIKSSGASDRD
ncbi:MAG: hypothetical protein LBC73_07990 [Oscillospiraceae bacterium]|jgi:hypothetical protein|nr:hypothetical protein [Oscillospiraceae bacterium]